MRHFVALALAVALTAPSWADAQNPAETCGRMRCRTRIGGREIARVDPYAFFEFAPSSGAGMTAACSCGAPAGARGETLTFTRASSGTCLKGGTATGITNSDLVTCSTDQARVMPGGDGTGGLGLLVEGERTNGLLRSEETENAAWSSDVFGASAITVTANAATAPDGNATADRWQIPAATSGQYTLRLQTLASATRSISIFVKGNAESGTFYLLTNSNCTICSYNATTWTRCVKENVASSTSVYFGSDPLDCGGGNQGAKDVFVWGAQAEVGAYVSSYIATTSAAVARAAEKAYFATSLPLSPLSIAASRVGPAATSAGNAGLGAVIGLGQNDTTETDLTLLYSVTASVIMRCYNTGANTSSSLTSSTSDRGWCQAATGSVSGEWPTGTAMTPASGTLDTDTGTAVNIGQFNAKYQADAVIKRVCVDPSPTRCR